MDASKTGDVKNNLTKFLKLIRKMKLETDPNVDQLLQGSPQAYLPVLHQALVHYSLLLSQWLTDKGYKLYGRNDLRFVEAMYKALRDVFSYKPCLTREQFLGKGFAERKMIMSARILELCLEKHKELSRRRNKHKARQREHADMGSKPPKLQYRQPQRVEPEIFNVCASEGVSSVWEELVDYRVDTPFSAPRRDQQALPSSLDGLTPPPTPRRGLPYPQYMGQITPTRRKNWMQIPQSGDLDITPVTTPLKPSVRVEREEAVEGATTSVWHPAARASYSSDNSSDTESLTSTEQTQPVVAQSLLPSTSQPPSQHHQSTAAPTPPQVSVDHLSCNACGGVECSNGLHSSLEQRIQELTRCIEKMSAKMVLLETQVQIGEHQGGKVQDPTSHSVPSHEGVRGAPAFTSTAAIRTVATPGGVTPTLEATAMGERSGTEDIAGLVSSEAVASQSRTTRAGMSEGQSRQWSEMERAVTPVRGLTRESPKSGLGSVATDTHKERSAEMAASDALIDQLRRRTQETQVFLHSVMSSRPSMVR